MEITGTILVKKDTQVVSEKFKKRNFVIETIDGNYTNQIELELQQDKCSLLDNFNIGQEVIAHVNIKGKKWTNPKGEDKYFTTLSVWRISGTQQAPSGHTTASTNVAESDEQGAETIQPSDGSDLPF